MLYIMVISGLILILVGLFWAAKELAEEDIIYANIELNNFKLYADNINDRLDAFQELLEEGLERGQFSFLPGQDPAEKKPVYQMAQPYQERLQEIESLRAAGLSDDQIAKQLKMNKGEVQLILNLSGK